MCSEMRPSENLMVYGVVVGSTGVEMTFAAVVVVVVGCVAKTVALLENGEGRCRILSRSAWEVYEKDPSYGSLKQGPAARVRSNRTVFPSVKSCFVDVW